MNYKNLAEEAVSRTNSYIGRLPENWITFNDRVNTRVLDSGENLQTKIKMIQNEIAILECELENSYLLITTHRVISKIGEEIQEVDMYEIEGFDSRDDKLNFKLDTQEQPKTHTITIRKIGNKKITYIIDSYFPSFFARLLIYNLSSFTRESKWYS
jgi:hypothetical protein